LIGTGGGLAWWKFGGGNGGPPPDTVAVTRATIEDSVGALGNIQPRDYVDVGTQVSGQLRKIHVEIGATVKEGDLLAEIDPTVFQARVDAGRALLANQNAQLAEREARLSLARRQLERQRNLRRANATSDEQLQVAETDVRVAETQIDALKAQIRQTESTLRADEANLGYTRIYAPMSGTVVSIDAKQGQTLNANQSAPIILRVADLSVMTVWTQVSEADVSRLRVGQTAYFATLGNPDRRYTGQLRQVLPTPEVENNVVLYNAIFDVPNQAGALMTQMTAQVFFVVARAENVLALPTAALRPLRGAGAQTSAIGQTGARDDDRSTRRFAVSVLLPDGSTEQRSVTVGVQTRTLSEIRAGLAEGDRVVLTVPPPQGNGRQQQRGPNFRPRLG